MSRGNFSGIEDGPRRPPTDTEREVGNYLVKASWSLAGFAIAGPVGALIGGGLAHLCREKPNGNNNNSPQPKP